METAYSQALTTNSSGWASFTHVQIFPNIGSVESLKLTLEAPTDSDCVIDEIYVGPRSGTCGFSEAVQVTVGSQSSFTIPQGTSVQTDEITLEMNGDLVVATAFSSDVQSLRASFGEGSDTSYYFKSGNDASTLSKSGYSAAGANPDALGLVNKVDVTRPVYVPPSYTPFELLRYDTYVAEWPIELVTAVDPIWEYSGYVDRAGLWRRFAHVLVEDVQQGDVIHVDCMLESTNPEDYAIEWVYGLVLTPQSSGTAGCEDMPSVSGAYEPTYGKLMSRMPGYNVSPALENGTQIFHGMRHGIFPQSVSYIVPEGVSGDQYVAAIGYAAGSSLTQSGDKLIIEQYCGDLSATLVRKA